MFQVIIMSFICIHVHESFWKMILKECVSDAWFSQKDIHEIYIVLYMIELMVLIESLYDEFILHSRTNVLKGESIVKPQKVPVPKTPLSSLFYRGSIVISSFPIFPRSYDKSETIFAISAKNLVGQGFGKILGPSEQKLKFSETRPKGRKIERCAPLMRRAPSQF